jgi:hypothetical protein
MVLSEIQDFLMVVLQMLITAFVPVLAALVWQWVQAKRAQIIDGLEASRYATFLTLLEVAVQAAEQAGIADLIANTAEAKKRYALNQLQLMLARYGFDKINVVELSGWIEAAIRQGLQAVTDVPLDPNEAFGPFTTMIGEPLSEQ